MPRTASVSFVSLTLALMIGCGANAKADLPPGLGVEVRLTSGALRGAALTGGGVVFKGVPYAAAPTGASRWRSPGTVAPWTGVRAAVVYGSACPQPDQGWNSTLIATANEDCLFLNVWTPAVRRDAHLPVMIWIHGGAFVGGAGTDPMFEGRELIKHGVVLVTLNYRLGVFGFLAHPDLTRDSAHHSSGNFGLEDQLAALRWVRDNIAAFGGDPGQITLFGQSAGGVSVTALLASPLSRGRFQRAIIESGSVLGAPVQNLKSAEAMGVAFAGAGAPGELRAMSAADVMKHYGDFTGAHHEAHLGPVVDHYVLDENPATAFQRHQELAVPLMIGNNAREGFGRVTEQALPGILQGFYGADAQRALPLYGVGTVSPESVDPVLGSGAAQWLTDSSFRCGAVITAARHAAGGSPVYEYQFEQSIPGREADGAAHTYELPYVFGTLRTAGVLGGAPMWLSTVFRVAGADRTFRLAAWRTGRRSAVLQAR